MKISIFVPSLGGGGAERVMVTLANEFCNRGFNVDLLLVSKHGPYLACIDSGVRVVDLNSGRALKALFPLIRYLRDERPNAMLSAIGHTNVIALLARRLAGFPKTLVISERGFISGEYALAKSFFARCNFLLIRLLYPWANRLSAVSHESARDLSEFVNVPLRDIFVIYNPFDLRFIVSRAAESLQHPWFLADDRPLILAVGRLNEAKDFSTLISAFGELIKRRPARLAILGDGELRGELEDQIKSLGLDERAICMPGFVLNPFSWMARCGVFVLSSRREGLPGALIEAMACGAPVISTDCQCGPAEILEGGRWGTLVPVGDTRKLASAMERVLASPRDQLPDVCRRAEYFDKNRAVDAYLKLLGLPSRMTGR